MVVFEGEAEAEGQVEDVVEYYGDLLFMLEDGGISNF